MWKADKNKDFKTKNEKLAKEIINFLIKHGAWIDTFIYVNNKRFGCNDGMHYHYDNNWDCVFVEDDISPCSYFEYANPDTLSMSFEGPLYDMLNYGYEFESYEKAEEEFSKILAKYGYYYELGNAWNLSCHKI